MSDDDFNFENEVQDSSWALLEVHEKRQAVYIISQDIDLVAVGNALASDDVTQTKLLLANKKLRRPDKEEIETWEADPALKIFRFLIVQPYVLIQLKESVIN